MTNGVPVRPDLVPAKSSLEVGRVAENPGSDISQKQTPKVVKGDVVVKKPNIFQRAFKSFVQEDWEHIKNSAIDDIVVPALKDVVMSSLSMMLWGTPNYRGRGGSGNGGRNDRVSYWSYSSGANTQRGDRGRYVDRSSQSDIRDLIFETRVDAEEVIGELLNNLNDYGKASVADFYDAAGISHDHTDINFGWLPGTEFRVRPVSGGYVIDMPRPRAFTR